MVYATFDEMRNLRPGGIALEDQARAEALLAEASTLVDEAVGPRAALWALPEAVIPAAVKSVTIQVALRVFDNPGGLSMEQATGYMYQRPQAGITGLELSRAERARVRRAAGLATGYSVRIPTGIDEESMDTIFAIEGGE